MLIREQVVRLCVHYRKYLPLIREFVDDILVLVDADELTELWVEQYEASNPYIAVTPLKKGRIGIIATVPNIPDFTELLEFLRSREIQCTRVPNESLGRVEGLCLLAADFHRLRQLQEILRTDTQ